jgi:hypothetical protein
MSRKEFYIGIVSILLAALSRCIPHPPNFTPILSMSLFGAFYFDKKWKAVLFPILAMMISDLILGVHTLLPLIYLTLALIALAPSWLRVSKNNFSLFQLSVLSSVFFFVVTNFFVWCFSSMYEKSLQGLAYCYTLAIPFFHWTLAGTLFYSALFANCCVIVDPP